MQGLDVISSLSDSYEVLYKRQIDQGVGAGKKNGGRLCIPVVPVLKEKQYVHGHDGQILGQVVEEDEGPRGDLAAVGERINDDCDQGNSYQGTSCAQYYRVPKDPPGCLLHHFHLPPSLRPSARLHLQAFLDGVIGPVAGTVVLRWCNQQVIPRARGRQRQDRKATMVP